jgi:hypothetical protein
MIKVSAAVDNNDSSNAMIDEEEKVIDPKSQCYL